MTRRLTIAALSLLLLSACSPSGADVIVGVDADTNKRVVYTQAQVEAFKSSLISETKKIPFPEGMEPDYTQIDQARFAAIVTRAEALCDDVRTSGWDSGRATYEDQLLQETLNSMPTDFPTDSTTESDMRASMAPFAEATLRAVAGQGSLCPELAPAGFLSHPIASAPAQQGKYYGEGCEGAGHALTELLPIVQTLDQGSTPPDADSQLTNIAAGFVYAAKTEPEKTAATALDDAAIAVLRLKMAVADGNAKATSSAIGGMSSAAVSIIDACGLE